MHKESKMSDQDLTRDHIKVSDASMDNGARAGIDTGARNPSANDVNVANASSMKAADPVSNGFPAGHDVIKGLDAPYDKQLGAPGSDARPDILPGIYGVRMLDNKSVYPEAMQANEAVQNGMIKGGDSSALKNLAQGAHDANGEDGVTGLAQELDDIASRKSPGGQVDMKQLKDSPDGSENYQFKFQHQGASGKMESNSVNISVKPEAPRSIEDTAPGLWYPNDKGKAGFSPIG